MQRDASWEAMLAAIFTIAQNRKASVFQLNADLVLSSRLQVYIQRL